MKNNRFLIIAFFAALLFSSTTQAQSSNYTNQDSFFGNGGFIHTVSPKSKNIKGSPFLYDYWYDATIKTTNNEEVNNIKLKYNIHLNEVLVLKPNGDSVALNNNIIKEFVITDLNMKEILFKRFPNINTNDNALKNGFVNVIYEGDVVLIVENKSKILKADQVQGGYGTYRDTDEFSKEINYYYIDKNKNVTEVNLNKKSLMAVLANKKDAIKAYIAKEKIDVTSLEGWSKTLTFYESF